MSATTTIITTKLRVSELKVGMYVSKLDRDWLDTPFLLQGFYLETKKDIETVGQYCQHVWIDIQKQRRIVEPADKPAKKSANANTPKPPHRYQNKTTFYQEHRNTSSFFVKARSLTKNLLDEIQLGGGVNTEAAKATVNEAVQSVIRHPDALMWMTRLRDESEYTAEHCMNVCILAVAFGRHLELDEQDLAHLGLCGLLHDVGKMRVPPAILDKPGRLTPKEMKTMMAHTIHGRNLLISAGNIYKGAVDVAYNHHERVDGKGYPRQLRGESISLFARMISIVDAYDAMTANRCYQPAKTTTEALKIIYQERGKQFDEKLALAFIETVGLYPPATIVELISGEVGVVIEVNQGFRHLPKVSIALDADKKPLKTPKVLNLSLIESGELGEEYLVRRVHPDGSFGLDLREYQKNGLFKH